MATEQTMREQVARLLVPYEWALVDANPTISEENRRYMVGPSLDKADAILALLTDESAVERGARAAHAALRKLTENAGYTGEMPTWEEDEKDVHDLCFAVSRAALAAALGAKP